MRTEGNLILSIVVTCGMCSAPSSARPGDDEDLVCHHALWEATHAEDATAAGFDGATGRDTRVFPRERVVDFEHMRLEVFIADMNRPVAQVTQTLTLAPIGAALAELVLDARSMTIEAAQVAGRATTFEHDGKRLVVRIDPPLAPGERCDLVTRYRLDDPPRGLIWTPETAEWPDRPAQIHTQGQPETNSYWFPCHDFPNERLTTEIAVTVPAGFVASANGYLAGQSRNIREVSGLGEGKALKSFETFHWKQDKPHVNYLVSLVVGKFDVVDVGDKSLSCPVYVPPGRGKDVAASYGRTPDMVRLFERRFSEPYPWARYAQLVVSNFEAGGMENTSATSMHDTAIHSPAALLDHDLDGLISHELGHQWFGDLITCKSWEHLWLNEGWATYCTALWMEERDGRDGYDRSMLGNFGQVLRADTGELPATVGMVSKAYEHPSDTFRRGSNPYPKGASILHMLRRRLGDETFFGAVADYIDRHKLGNAETDQFRRALEERSGLSLEQFFTQWCTRPNVPRCTLAWEFDAERRKLRVTIEQTQKVDGDNPAFEFSLPVFVRNSAGPDVVAEFPVSARKDTFEVDLEGLPGYIAVDPDMTVLGSFEIDQSAQMWTAMLESGSALPSRVRAARALAKLPEQGDREALRTIASDPKASTLLRTECIKALQARNALADLRSLAAGARDSWEVREQVVSSLAAAAKAEQNKGDDSLRGFVERLILARATGDQSVKVRAAAIRAIGAMNIEDGMTYVYEALDTSSQSDAIRLAGLDALENARPPGALATALRYAQAGYDPRTRGSAIDAARKLADQDPELAYNGIAQLLGAREMRARMAAASALADLGDARGLAALAESIERERAPDTQKRLTTVKSRLEKKIAESTRQTGS